VEIQRRLVLDANILVRAVLGRRVRQIITDHTDRVAFFAPAAAYADARKHLPTLLDKRFRDAEAVATALVVLDRIEAVVHSVAEETYATQRAAGPGPL